MTGDIERLEALLEQKETARAQQLAMARLANRPPGRFEIDKLDAVHHGINVKFARMPVGTLDGCIFKLQTALDGLKRFDPGQRDAIMLTVLNALLSIRDHGEADMQHGTAPEGDTPDETIQLCAARLNGIVNRRLKLMLGFTKLTIEATVPERQKGAVANLQRSWNIADHGTDAEFAELIATMAGASAAIRSEEKAEKEAAKPKVKRPRRKTAQRRVRAEAQNVVTVDFGGRQ